MKKICFIILIFTSGFIFSQVPTFQWARLTGGYGLDNGTSVTTDKMGNIYSTALFNNTAFLNPPLSVLSFTPKGDFDALIKKSDCNGGLIWAKQIGGIGKDIPYSVVCDSLFNVYISGSFSDTVDFDPGIGTYTLSSNGNSDAFLLKLDQSGNFVWAKQFGASGTDEGTTVALDKIGDSYMTGTFWGSVDFDPGINSYNLTSNGNQDIFIVKLNSSGNFVYARNLGGLSYESGLSIKVDPNKNVYTTGWFMGLADFDPSINTYTLLANSWSTDIFVSKLDSLGNFVWAANTGGSILDYGYSIDLDSKQNVIVTGFFQNVSDFDPGPATFTLSSFGLYDVFLWKLDKNGNYKWAKQMGGTSEDIGYDLAIDAQDNIYSTGSFGGTSDFDPGPGVVNPIATGFADVFIDKLDSMGNLVWVTQLGGTDLESGISIDLDVFSNIYTTGLFQSACDFDPGPAIDTLNYYWPSDDTYLVKFGQNCVTDMKESIYLKGLNVYPNPSSGQFNLIFDKVKEKNEIKIFNSLSQIVLQKNILSTDKISLSISDQPSGIYFVEVNADGESYRAKVVRE